MIYRSSTSSNPCPNHVGGQLNEFYFSIVFSHNSRWGCHLCQKFYAGCQPPLLNPAPLFEHGNSSYNLQQLAEVLTGE